MNAITGLAEGIREKQRTFLSAIKELFGFVDVKKLIYAVLFGVLGIFISRCGFSGAVYPFGQSFFVCMLLYSAYSKAALIGCIIGWLSMFPAVPLEAPAVSFACLGAVTLLSKRFKVDRERLLHITYIFTCAVGAVLFNMGGRFFFLVGICGAVISIVSLFAFERAAKALFVHKRRRSLTDDEAVCIVFCLCIAVLATAGLKLFDFEINLIIGGLITMLFGYMFGGTVGAAAGLLCGLCVFLGGGSIYVMGSMGVCGFFAGLSKKGGRIAAISAYVFANALLTLYINGSSFVILPIRNTLVSGGLLLAIPSPFMQKLDKLLCSTAGRSKSEGYYVEKCSKLARERLNTLAGLFNTMSEVFAQGGHQYKEEVNRIITAAADESCSQCSKCDDCWGEGFMPTYSAFESVVDSVASGGENVKMERCVNEAGVRSAVENAVRRAKNGASPDKKMGNELLSEQFKGLSSVLTKINGEIKDHIRFEEEIETNIKDELIRLDIGVYDVCVMRIAGAHRCEVIVDKDGDSVGERCKIGAVVSKYCGRPMVLDDSRRLRKSNGSINLIYTAAKPLFVNSFMAQQAKESVCGDSFKIGHISENRYMLCLSDGMGSGKEAKAESSACVKLLYSFFKAGFDEEVTFSAVNKLLMLKSETEIFTTVDLCTVDTVTSKAVFTKIGAVPSVLIKKDGTTAIIRGDSLPLGILDKVNAKSFEFNVEDGDMLVMFTDGIYDVLCSKDMGIDEAVVGAIGGEKDIRIAASKILDKCRNLKAIEDDMTVLLTAFKKEK